MTLTHAQQQRLLERLRHADDPTVALADLHAGGIDFPAAVVCELELNGYLIDRVYDHGRLAGMRQLEPEPAKRPPRTGRAARPDSQPPHTPRPPRMGQAVSKSSRCPPRSITAM